MLLALIINLNLIAGSVDFQLALDRIGYFNVHEQGIEKDCLQIGLLYDVTKGIHKGISTISVLK